MAKKPQARRPPEISPESIEWHRQQFLKTRNPYYAWHVIFWTKMFDFEPETTFQHDRQEQLQKIQEEYGDLLQIAGINLDEQNVTVPRWIADCLAGVALRMTVSDDGNEAYVLGLRPPKGESADEYNLPERGPGYISQARNRLLKEAAKLEVGKRIAKILQKDELINKEIVGKICKEVAKDMELAVDGSTVRDWYYRQE